MSTSVFIDESFRKFLNETFHKDYPIDETVYTKYGKAKIYTIKGIKYICIAGTIFALINFFVVLIGPFAASMVGDTYVGAGAEIATAEGYLAGGVITASVCHIMTKKKNMRLKLRIDKKHKVQQMPNHVFARLNIVDSRSESRKLVKMMKKLGLLTKDRMIVELEAKVLEEKLSELQDKLDLDSEKLLKIREVYNHVAMERK